MSESHWFRVESKRTYHAKKYRFASLYNGVRGPWNYRGNGAVGGGEARVGLIRELDGSARRISTEEENNEVKLP